jgi:hypothetical protein
MKTNQTSRKTTTGSLLILVGALAAALLGTGCASLFKGYDASALPPGYQEAFKVATRIFPAQDKLDYWQTPRETRERGTGDCEDLAFLLEDEAHKRGLDITVQFGKAHVSNTTFHAWNEVLTADGKRVIMDALLGIWMVNPGPGYYVKCEMAKTEYAVGFMVNELDYSIRKGDEESRTRSTAGLN